MTTKCDDDAVADFIVELSDFTGRQLRGVVRCQHASCAEVSGDRNHVVATGKKLGAELLCRPGVRTGRSFTLRLDQRVLKETGARPGCSRGQVGGQRLSRIANEVVTGDERRTRGDHTARCFVCGDGRADVVRGVDESANGKPGDRHGTAADRQIGRGAIEVLPSNETRPKTCFRSRVWIDRRDVLTLVRKSSHVLNLVVRDHIGAARENDVLQSRRSVTVDNSLDLLGDEILGERTCLRCVGLVAGR